jgi:L-threonylcarbamoyladenylate synthase
MNHWRIKQAAAALRRGGIIAYPTEAVWGVGCDPFNRVAVQHLLQLKQRPQHKGLILVAAGIDQLDPLFAPLSEAQQQQLEASWPGPNTWLLPDPDNLIPRWVKGAHNSIAVRVTAHPQTAALCRAYGGLLVSTSANRAGQPPALTAAEVRAAFDRRLDYLLPGALGGRSQPSVIRDLKTGQILR